MEKGKITGLTLRRHKGTCQGQIVVMAVLMLAEMSKPVIQDSLLAVLLRADNGLCGSYASKPDRTITSGWPTTHACGMRVGK